MIDSVGIYKKANKLVELHETRDTIKLAKASGVEVIPVDCFNNLLDEYLTLMVAGHELGHDVYHRELAKGEGMREFELFRMQSSTEYEANAFAAHLLIDTNECLEYARNGYDVVQIARAMNSEINLMLIKLQEMSRLSYNIRVPFEPKSDFFKNIKA